MLKRVFSAVMFILLLTSMLILAFNIQPVRATGTIYIRADGSIDPPTAPISTVDNLTYTFTGDIINDSIVVERDNIVVDGAGYTLQGTYVSESRGTDVTGRSSVTIKNTNIRNYEYGIMLDSSSSNSISGNNITANNRYGIMLDSSSSNSISGNMFINNGLFVKYSHQNSVENNTVNGRPLVYLEGASNYTIDDAGQVILVRSENIRVEGLNLSRTAVSVELWETGDSTISGNNITANNGYGIYLFYSSGNSISGNDVTANYYDGIWLYSSSGNSIFENNITANNGYGILLGSSSGNSIFHNNFINNAQQVYSSDSVNVWDDGYPSVGNYWSDYTGTDGFRGPFQNETGSDALGDTPYFIDSNNTDRYPLMNLWVRLPGDINGDGTVNILDAITLGNAFLVTPGSSNWNPNADINGDNVVNILDAIILANHFLQHRP